MSGPTPKKGETFPGVVRDLASDGRGIVAHPNGLTVFVPGVWVGEEGRFRFTGLERRVGTAEVLEISKPSPHRVNPQCPYHGFAAGDCGGCPWQFIAYEEQLRVKQARVANAFARIAPVEINPIWASPSAYGYRNRAQLKTNGQIIGYVSAGSHTLAAVEDCPILTAPNRETLKQLVRQLPKPEWRAWGREKWRTLNFDETTGANDVRVDERLPFQQSNSEQNQSMRQWLAARCEALDKNSKVLELFCGSGNFTEVLASAQLAHIIAADAAREAVDELVAKQLPGVSAHCVDLFNDAALEKLVRQHGPFDHLVLDPPRDGLKSKVGLFGKRPLFKNIFYVSCNLATLSRDVQAFVDSGYKVREVQALDQAPHSAHIEILVHLLIEPKKP